MKRRLSRAEWALFLIPLLGLGAWWLWERGEQVVPSAVRHATGRPQVLTTAPNNDQGVLAAIRRVTGRPLSLSTDAGDMLRGIALSADGSILAAGGTNLVGGNTTNKAGTIYFWDARTLKSLPPFPSRVRVNAQGRVVGGDSVFGLAVALDGSSFGADRHEKAWTLYDRGTLKRRWTHPHRISAAAFSPDGTRVALASDARVWIVATKNGAVVTSWPCIHSLSAGDVAWSPDGQVVATTGGTGSGQGGVEVHRVADAKQLYFIRWQTKPPLKEYDPYNVSFSPDGRRMVVTGSGGGTLEDYFEWHNLRVYDVASGRLVWSKSGRHLYDGSNFSSASANDAIFSPDGRHLLINLMGDSGIVLLRASDGTIVSRAGVAASQGGNFYVPSALALSPDGKRLFARGKNAVLVWELELE